MLRNLKEEFEKNTRVDPPIKLIDVAARMHERDGIRIPLLGKRFDIASIRAQLYERVREGLGRIGETTYVSAMCVPHRKIGASASISYPTVLGPSKERIDETYLTALQNITSHLNETGGNGCDVYLKVTAPDHPSHVGQGL